MSDRPDTVPEDQGLEAVEDVGEPRRLVRPLAVTVVVVLLISLGVFFAIMRPWLIRRWVAQRVSETVQTFPDFQGDAWSVAFTPDGRRLVGSSGMTVEFRDVQTGRKTLVLEGHSNSVNMIAISPDGQRLASTSWDKTIKLWDTGSGRELRSLEGHSDWVLAVDFSPDGSQLASAGRDFTARLWDVETGKQLRSFKARGGFVVDVDFSPDGKHIATAASFRPFNMGESTITLNEPGEINLWNTLTGKQSLSLKGHTSAILGVNFSPDGRFLVSVSREHTAKLWNAKTGQELLTFTGHDNSVVSADFSPDGRRLATASDDGTVRLWNVETGKELLALDTSRSGAFCVKFSQDGRRLAVGGFYLVTLWDLGSLDRLD